MEEELEMPPLVWQELTEEELSQKISDMRLRFNDTRIRSHIVDAAEGFDDEKCTSMYHIAKSLVAIAMLMFNDAINTRWGNGL